MLSIAEAKKLGIVYIQFVRNQWGQPVPGTGVAAMESDNPDYCHLTDNIQLHPHVDAILAKELPQSDWTKAYPNAHASNIVRFWPLEK